MAKNMVEILKYPHSTNDLYYKLIPVVIQINLYSNTNQSRQYKLQSPLSFAAKSHIESHIESLSREQNKTKSLIESLSKEQKQGS